MANGGSSWNAIMQYSFLHVFAHDGQIDHEELQMLERLALQDGVIHPTGAYRADPGVRAREPKRSIRRCTTEIERFKTRFDIP